MIDATPIGVVETDAGEPLPEERTDRESTVDVDADYVEGLYRIEGNDHLVVGFHLHEASEPTLRGPRRYGEERGVFASRSPNRPGKVGVTTVELLERDGRRLRVRGLDARDGTPVLDVKPHAPSLDCPSRAPGDDRRENPRGRVDRAVRARDLETLLLDAGGFHGHFCPELSFGLVAGVFARRELGVDPGDGEALVTVVETNDCFADGIQYATGCTFGNGGLVYRDLGKPAVAVVRRGGRGVRIAATDPDVFDESSWPDDGVERGDDKRNSTGEGGSRVDERRAAAAFDVIRRPLETFCDVRTHVPVEIPDPTAVGDVVNCADCGEPVRASRAVRRDGESLCLPCAGDPHPQLDASGLHC